MIDPDEVYFKEKKQRLTHSPVNSMKVTIPIQRSLIPGHNDLYEITWKDFLDKVNSVFPGILLCSYVCKAQANHQEVFISFVL